MNLLIVSETPVKTVVKAIAFFLYLKVVTRYDNLLLRKARPV